MHILTIKYYKFMNYISTVDIFISTVLYISTFNGFNVFTPIYKAI